MKINRTGIRLVAAATAVAVALGTSGVAGAQNGSGSSGFSLSSGSAGSSGGLGEEDSEQNLHDRVAAGEITALVAEGHLPELVELGYVDELISAGFVDELIEIGYFEPSVGINESGVCPAVVVIVGRGSGQNTRLIPTRYSETAPWVSNGREAETWQAFFHAAEAQYQLDNPGESLMADVHVLGLPEDLYPATHIRPPVDLSDAGSSAGEVLSSTVDGYFASIDQGTEGVQEAIARLEADTGCSPQYILAGYSQGAVALLPNERQLADAGKLAGALYLGNPLLTPDRPEMIGTGATGGGILHRVRPNVEEFAAADNRLEYCIAGDLICDLNIASVSDGSSRTPGSSGGLVNVLGNLLGGPHLAYFDGPASLPEDEAAVTRAFASWVDQVRDQASFPAATRSTWNGG